MKEDVMKNDDIDVTSGKEKTNVLNEYFASVFNKVRCTYTMLNSDQEAEDF